MEFLAAAAPSNLLGKIIFGVCLFLPLFASSIFMPWRLQSYRIIKIISTHYRASSREGPQRSLIAYQLEYLPSAAAAATCL
jgi:hypothetical protein